VTPAEALQVAELALEAVAEGAELAHPWPAMLAEHRLGGLDQVRAARCKVAELGDLEAAFTVDDTAHEVPPHA